MATIDVKIDAEVAATACCKSVVNVAIPQRRGSELPMKAMR
jgi:hypothetical protein